MRHPKEGAPMVAAAHSRIPVINAGDGGHQHPTQTLTDMLTIRSLKGQLDGFTIGLCGDLKFGRTVHSLANALCLYDNVELYFVSPDKLKMPQEILHDLDKMNMSYTEVSNINEIIDKVNVLYVTRIQKERFGDINDYLKIKGAYIVNKKLLEGKDLIVMHPLPRIDEIAGDVDNTKYNKYFTQAANAVPVRMAILKTLINNNPK
jgi:aspartate carbamoyltransferase catalytic subunit